jgi:tetrahydromethanopterin S-methyltransferase subunit E
MQQWLDMRQQRKGPPQLPLPRAANDPAVNPMPDQEVKRSFDTTSDFATKFSNRVRGLDFANLVFIEVFSGTAGLTAAVRRVGDANMAPE